jgi:hypothetical protein
LTDLIYFPWQMVVQTSEVPPGLPHGWDIPAEGKVYACVDERMRDYNGDEITRAVEGFMWVHVTQTRLSLQKGFSTLEAAEAAARARARLSGAVYVPSIKGGDNDA